MMEYTVQKLGELAGISTRTLRYYDTIGLLKPAGKSDAGYRLYGTKEVDRLQQILFYRELGFPLDTIGQLLDSPDFDHSAALARHREQLLAKRRQLDLLIDNVEKTLSAAEGRIDMADEEKFQGFKRQLVEDNEAAYGEEIRERYSNRTVDEANAKMLQMSEETYSRFRLVEQQVLEMLAKAMETGDPASELAQQTAALHKEWLLFTWPTYSKAAHAGLAEMYAADGRFAAYYDRVRPGAAAFLHDAILIYTKS